MNCMHCGHPLGDKYVALHHPDIDSLMETQSTFALCYPCMDWSTIGDGKPRHAITNWETMIEHIVFCYDDFCDCG